MQCPFCAQAKLIHDTSNVPYTYKGESTTISNITGDFCPACADAIFEPAEARKFGKLVSKFIQQVNSSFVDP